MDDEGVEGKLAPSWSSSNGRI